MRALTAAMLLALIVTLRPAVADAPAAPLQARIAAAIARVYPALVQIHVVSAAYRDGRELKEEAVGSGAIISPDGLVITNHHVAGNAIRIRVRLSDRREFSARLVGTDPLSDIAIIRIEGAPPPLPVAAFGDSDALRVGDRVLAMGCPIALSQSVTMGIVSNTDLVFPRFFWPFTFKLEGEEVGSLVQWIGHDAPIYPGNSGGPLVDLSGRIVGINELDLGLSAAIPANLANEVADQLIHQGKVTRSWLGLVCQPRLDGQAGPGALVAEVVKSSPADIAGIHPGDLLVRLGSHVVNVRYAEDLQPLNREIFALPPGAPVELDVTREGGTRHFKVVPIPREAVQGRETAMPAWGMSVRGLTAPMARELELDGDRGVLVTSVAASGAAGNSRPPLQAEDLIVSVASQPIRDLAQLGAVTQKLRGARKGEVPVLVAFERRGQRMLTVVRLGESHEGDGALEVRKAWAPVAWQVLTPELGRALGITDPGGVVVTAVLGRAGGLRNGDVITKVDGKRVSASQPEDYDVFAEMIRSYPVGAKATLTVLDPVGHHPHEVTLTLGEQPPEGLQLHHYRDSHFDFEVREPSPMDDPQHPGRVDRGVRVSEVQPGGWAALAHLAVGDEILQVDGATVSGLDDFERHMRAVAAARAAHVAFFVRRGPHTMFLDLEPDWARRS